MFQFQLGAIGRTKLIGNAVPPEVSIPAWCDWERMLGYQLRQLRKVSIPAWCDWELYQRLNNNILQVFQFQLGAIGRTLIILLGMYITLFQFQLGAIGSALEHQSTIIRMMFQFQLGAIGSRSSCK